MWTIAKTLGHAWTDQMSPIISDHLMAGGHPF